MYVCVFIGGLQLLHNIIYSAGLPEHNYEQFFFVRYLSHGITLKANNELIIDTIILYKLSIALIKEDMLHKCSKLM